MGQTNVIIKAIGDTFGRLLPDKLYLTIRYYMTFHRPIHWKNPKTYNEKLQWLKLYDRNPLYSTLVDKYEVKGYIAEHLGKQYIIPNLGVWDRFEDINFDELPEKFVLKCTHDTGSVMICHDKKTFDYEKARKHFHACLKRDGYHGGREWPYKNVKSRIIAEEYMVDESGTGLRDFKFFCFDGKVRALSIATDRGVEGKDVKFDFFDQDFHWLPFTRGHEHAEIRPQKPENFDEMKRISELLSTGMKHVRVDLYDINGQIYFGELTFYNACGFVPFNPDEWDTKFGEWMRLN